MVKTRSPSTTASPLFVLTMGATIASGKAARFAHNTAISRSEEHTSELQSHLNLVCRLLLEKKKHITERQGELNIVGEPSQVIERPFGIQRFANIFEIAALALIAQVPVPGGAGATAARGPA